MHCTSYLLAHICSCMLGHAEPEFEVPTEQVSAEDFTNLVWIKASPGESHQLSLDFLLITIFMLYLIVH
jgi:hypothetical protein